MYLIIAMYHAPWHDNYHQQSPIDRPWSYCSVSTTGLFGHIVGPSNSGLWDCDGGLNLGKEK